MKIKGTTVFPSTLKAVLDATLTDSSYAIIARRENDLSDAVEIKFSSAENPAKIIAAMKEQFQGSVKVIPQITAVPPAEIEKLQLPEGARKRRYFVDLRD
jgi:phenylacetate-coenzyme A ligase PaaK-like adenylate-forming protein